jgi:hypothetical protein
LKQIVFTLEIRCVGEEDLTNENYISGHVLVKDMDDEDYSSPLSDLPDSLEDKEPLLEELSNRELKESAEMLEELVDCVGRLSQISGENGTPADIIPENVTDEAKKLARVSNRLAEHRDRIERISKQAEGVDVQSVPDDLPDGVPSKATLTTKTINNNDYYYWQWREGDNIKSKYEAPVNPSD